MNVHQSMDYMEMMWIYKHLKWIEREEKKLITTKNSWWKYQMWTILWLTKKKNIQRNRTEFVNIISSSCCCSRTFDTIWRHNMVNLFNILHFFLLLSHLLCIISKCCTIAFCEMLPFDLTFSAFFGTAKVSVSGKSHQFAVHLIFCVFEQI